MCFVISFYGEVVDSGLESLEAPVVKQIRQTMDPLLGCDNKWTITYPAAVKGKLPLARTFTELFIAFEFVHFFNSLACHLRAVEE